MTGYRRDDRDVVARDFTRLFAADFAEHGAKAIADLRTTKVDVYLRLAAAMEPAAARSASSVVEEMTDEHVIAIVDGIRRWEKDNSPEVSPSDEAAP
jgi:hypothetical protein